MGMLRRLAIEGNYALPEFQFALKNNSFSADACYFSNLEELRLSEDAFSVILLLQSRPQERTKESIELLIQKFPLAPIVVVYSDWSEGERRTGFPLEGLIRVPWYNFPLWFDRQYKFFQAGKISQLSLPSGASEAQRAELESLLPFPSEKESNVWIFSDSALRRNTILRFHQSLQANAWAFGLNDTPDAAAPVPNKMIFALDAVSETSLQIIRSRNKTYRETVMYAIVSQPSLKEAQLLNDAGVKKILSPEIYQYTGL